MGVGGSLARDLYKSEHKPRIAEDRVQSQFIDCYDFANQGGNRLRAIDYISALRQYNFDNVPSGFENRASSMRFTGAPDDWTASTINMYYNEYFIGDEEYAYNDVSAVLRNNAAKSVIVTGCQPWTVYSNTGYTGNCKCLYPENTSTCKPGFYSTESSLGYMSRSISSARKGCYCSQKALPDNVMKGSHVQGGYNPGQ